MVLRAKAIAPHRSALNTPSIRPFHRCGIAICVAGDKRLQEHFGSFMWKVADPPQRFEIPGVKAGKGFGQIHETADGPVV
jgi:hypothetical protein